MSRIIEGEHVPGISCDHVWWPIVRHDKDCLCGVCSSYPKNFGLECVNCPAICTRDRRKMIVEYDAVPHLTFST